MTLFPYLLVSVQLIYTYKIEQKGVSAKPKTLNPNDLYGFYRQEMCRLFGGWDGWVLGTSANVGRSWGRELGTSINIDRGLPANLGSGSNNNSRS